MVSIFYRFSINIAVIQQRICILIVCVVKKKAKKLVIISFSFVYMVTLGNLIDAYLLEPLSFNSGLLVYQWR